MEMSNLQAPLKRYNMIQRISQKSKNSIMQRGENFQSRRIFTLRRRRRKSWS